MALNQKNSSIKLNLSNQSNLANAFRSHLSQFNFLVVLGNKFLSKADERQAKVPLQVYINKSGELTIGGLDNEIINNKEMVQIYTDKKIT